MCNLYFRPMELRKIIVSEGLFDSTLYVLARTPWKRKKSRDYVALGLKMNINFVSPQTVPIQNHS